MSDERFDELFRRALAFDERGDWAEAIEIYESIAREAQGTREATYASDYAQRLRGYQAVAAEVDPFAKYLAGEPPTKLAVFFHGCGYFAYLLCGFLLCGILGMVVFRSLRVRVEWWASQLFCGCLWFLLFSIPLIYRDRKARRCLERGRQALAMCQPSESLGHFREAAIFGFAAASKYNFEQALDGIEQVYREVNVVADLAPLRELRADLDLLTSKNTKRYSDEQKARIQLRISHLVWERLKALPSVDRCTGS